MGGQTVDASRFMQRPAATGMYDIEEARSRAGMEGLKQQGQLLGMYSQMPPPTQRFDLMQTSKQAAEFGMGNLQYSKELERLTSPETAKMREELGSRVAEATNPEATKQWAAQQALKTGLMRGIQTGVSPESSIARSAMFDLTTQAGQEAQLRNLGIQQSYLGATPAPVGGLDPATLISMEQSAKAQNLEAMRRWQENVMGGQLGLAQSQSDWINQSLGNLANIGRTQQQDIQNYQQAMLQQKAQEVESKNRMKGSMIAGGGALAGATITAAATAIAI